MRVSNKIAADGGRGEGFPLPPFVFFGRVPTHMWLLESAPCVAGCVYSWYFKVCSWRLLLRELIGWLIPAPPKTVAQRKCIFKIWYRQMKYHKTISRNNKKKQFWKLAQAAWD